MFVRLCVTATVAFLCSVCAPRADATVGVRGSLLVGVQDLGLRAFSPNVDFSATTRSSAFGGGVEIALPYFGARVGGNALVHLGETATQSIDARASGRLDVGGTFVLDATEFTAYVESRFDFAPTSPYQPFFGVGGAIAHMRVDGEIETEGSAVTRSSLSGASNVFRAYGVAGVQLARGFAVVVRGGYAFHDGLTMAADELRLTGTPAGATFDYEGFYASAGVSVLIR